MARVTPAKTNFNAGEISRRLRGRVDLNLYDIACDTLIGFAPLQEGGMEAMPGLIRVAAAGGPCRLVPFEYNVTQGYVIEMRAGAARFFTNDVQIVDGEDAPIELELPYTLDQISALTWEQSYDVLYLFHREKQTQLLTRIGADEFELNPLTLENGPFEARNSDKTSVVSANGVQGTVTLTATKPIFAAGDVGSLFQLEAGDFGDITAWEPGITVTNGQLLTWGDRVYGVVGGSGRTGSLAPVHGEGVEWDGIGQGQDVAGNNAGGVQLEYLHDRFGVLRITEFTDATHVTALVLRRLPFTASTSQSWTGGYWEGGEWVPPEDAVTYQYGTWRWRFGAFSDTRGHPTCGVVWNERLCLAKDSFIYASVAGDLTDFSAYNELGEISADMAFTIEVPNPNAVLSLIADEKLLVNTASGMFAVGGSNAAQGVGPGNVRIDRQNNEGAIAGKPIELDGRFLYISKNRRRVIEASYDAALNRQGSIDLSRYARHMGASRLLELAPQKDPLALAWARRADGSMAAACYVPNEEVLGWARRPVASGAAVQSICSISDPQGENAQLWAAVTLDGDWHIARMDQFREEGDETDPAMTDLCAVYEGDAATEFGPYPWLAGKSVHVQADDAQFADIAVDDAGMFTLQTEASRVIAGLPFQAKYVSLPFEGGSDSGTAMGKMKRASRVTLNVLKSRGLKISVGNGPVQPIEQLTTDSVTDSGFAPDTGILIQEQCGDWDRLGQITIERYLPAASTILAIVPTMEVADR